MLIGSIAPILAVVGNVIVVDPSAWARHHEPIAPSTHTVTISPPRAEAGTYTLDAGGHRARLRLHESCDAEIAAELMCLAMERTIALFELAAPEWVDIGGES